MAHISTCCCHANSKDAVVNIKLRELKVPCKYATFKHEVKHHTQQVIVPCETGAGGGGGVSPEGTGKLGPLSASGTHKIHLNQKIWRNELLSQTSVT